MSSNGFHSSRSHNLRSLFSLFSSDLAIDLGTANTLVYARGKGIVVNEPSIVAITRTPVKWRPWQGGERDAGPHARNIVAIKPMKDGVIADFKVTEKMLNYFIQKAHNRKMLVHPRIVIECLRKLPRWKTRGDGLGVSRQSERSAPGRAGHGGGDWSGTADYRAERQHGGGYWRWDDDIAVISLSGIVYSRSVRMAGNQMDEAIMNYLKRKYNLLIGSAQLSRSRWRSDRRINSTSR